MAVQALVDINRKIDKSEILRAIMDTNSGFWLLLQSNETQSDEEVELILNTLAQACDSTDSPKILIQVYFPL